MNPTWKVNLKLSDLVFERVPGDANLARAPLENLNSTIMLAEEFPAADTLFELIKNVGDVLVRFQGDFGETGEFTLRRVYPEADDRA